MTCREFLKVISASPSVLLDELGRNSAKTDSDTALRGHLASCGACAKTLELERQFRGLIKHHVSKAHAPEALLDRVLDRAALEGFNQTTGNGTKKRIPKLLPSMRRYPVRSLAYSLAACLLVSLIFFTLIPSNKSQSAVLEVVERHLHSEPKNEPEGIDSSDCAEVEVWFKRQQIDFAVKVPECGDRLLGGKRCSLLNRGIAQVFYEKEDEQISLFIMEDRGLNLEMIPAVEYKNKQIRVTAYKGHHLVCWQKSGLAYAFVSELPSEVLLDMAAQL